MTVTNDIFAAIIYVKEIFIFGLRRNNSAYRVGFREKRKNIFK
jgi:hypothetical protein